MSRLESLPEALFQPSVYVIDLDGIELDRFRIWPKDDVALDGLVLHGPLYMAGSSLGFIPDPEVYISDSAGLVVVIKSVETLLQIIDHFTEPDRSSLLACAASHFGFVDVLTLIRGRDL